PEGSSNIVHADTTNAKLPDHFVGFLLNSFAIVNHNWMQNYGNFFRCNSFHPKYLPFVTFFDSTLPAANNYICYKMLEK
ncbi:MAG: hypothetical protein RLY16_2059, partial [Bacteroidota bacterium]